MNIKVCMLCGAKYNAKPEKDRAPGQKMDLCPWCEQKMKEK